MKSQNYLDKCIQCPKCGTRTMRKAVGKGPEYFDDKCHSYFTIEELVNVWGYDLGDFYGSNKMTELELDTFATLLVMEKDNIPYYPITSPLVKEYVEKRIQLNGDKIIATTWWDGDSVSAIDEPTFKSPSERLEAYEMVDRMFIGIPEWSMESNEVDTGATFR